MVLPWGQYRGEGGRVPPMKAKTATKQVEEAEEFDPHSVEAISAGNWERTLRKFTEDMDPWAIDVVELADRYKSYIDRAESFDLE
ncbi:MAG: hypothetical protein ABEI97_00900, partial [Candidatus Nanohaloarchaea archaeon]